MPEIFDDLRVFESWFDAKEMHANESEAERIMNQERKNDILTMLHQVRYLFSTLGYALPSKRIYLPLIYFEK